MTMADRIPALDDKGLANLLANARRLETEGAPAQQQAAAEMIPLIQAELDTRQAAKPKPVRKTPAPRAKKKPAAPAA